MPSRLEADEIDFLGPEGVSPKSGHVEGDFCILDFSRSPTRLGVRIWPRDVSDEELDGATSKHKNLVGHVTRSELVRPEMGSEAESGQNNEIPSLAADVATIAAHAHEERWKPRIIKIPSLSTITEEGSAAAVSLRSSVSMATLERLVSCAPGGAVAEWDRHRSLPRVVGGVLKRSA